MPRNRQRIRASISPRSKSASARPPRKRKKALDGYTILKEGNQNVDLNEKAGGGIGSDGDRVVYLGYKTTHEISEAVTDLAVMNMKGGYSVRDYEMLMEQQMTQQIIPFVDDFLVTVKEYRENYKSTIPENKARAEYVHDALNKLTDDDCDNADLGDLHLNETKYEMGDGAYNALSDAEKKQHADILTIVTQASGKATLVFENLITRASDTNEDTWIDRFTKTNYNDLLDLYPDMLPEDAKKELAKDFDDDAKKILEMWDPLKQQLDNYDKNKAKLDELTNTDLTEQKKIVDEFDAEKATQEQKDAYIRAFAEITVNSDAITALYADMAAKEYLSGVAFQDGTLADFFTQDRSKVASDITVLYPLIASLSEGQRAGLDFVTLSDLIMFSATNSEVYKSASIDGLETTSVYEGVDRDI